ncbi:MAG: hypothetical protein FWH22_05555 [Fibromonadales bacterium]|nr:hypothetical protein [Fibromonadales bacterium]
MGNVNLFIIIAALLTAFGCGKHSFDEQYDDTLDSSSSNVASSSSDDNNIVENPLTVGEYVHTMPDGRTMTVYYILPPNMKSETRVLFLMAGTNRTSGISDIYPSIPMAVVANIVVIRPDYTREDFPFNQYQMINVGNAGSRKPYEEWSFNHIDRIFVEFTAQHGLSAAKYILYGFSAGGQFTHRTLMLSQSPYLDYGIAGGAGTYLFYREDWPYPRGLSDLIPLYKNNLLNNLANKKLYVLVGENDNDPNGANLDRGAWDVQGIQRLERATNYYAAAKDYAEEHNINFNWEFYVVPDADHSTGVRSQALDIITGNNYYYKPAAPPPIQRSGQERIYGTWYRSNNVYVLTEETLSYFSSSDRFVIGITAIEAVANTGQYPDAPQADYPNGYRIRGVYTETNQSSTSIGDAFSRIFYISPDNTSIMRTTGNVWNRYR